METIAFSGTLRKEAGNKAVLKKMRGEELVPCVLYGGKENVNFSAPESSFRPIIFSPYTYIIALSIDGKEYKSVLKDTQFHPVAGNLLHADFYEVSETEPVVVKIPVKVIGQSEGVKMGGKLTIDKRKLAVKGLLKSIPSEIEVDITELVLGKSIRAGEIKCDGLEILEPVGSPVLSIRATRASRAAATEK